MRFLIILIISLFTTNVFAQGPYAPDADNIGTTAIHKDSSIFIDWAISATIERGWQNIADTTLGKTTTGSALSPTDKSGINGVVSLGDNGSAILTFTSPIINGTGPDFAVFENSFDNNFLELAHVEVSSDGNNYYRFPSISLSQDTIQIMNVVDPTNIHNLAGKYKAQYGTPFDLEDLNGTVGLDINNITHVKIIDVVGSINETFATHDSQGNTINDPYPTPFETGGFDLDAIGVIHSWVGISEIQSDFHCYPNPANDKVTIQTRSLSLKKIELVDFEGRVVNSFITSDQNYLLDISSFAKGIYLLKVTEDKKVRIKKLLIN